MIINLFDKSGTGKLSAEWMTGLAQALTAQLTRHVIPHYGLEAWSIIYCAKPEDAFAGGAELSFFLNSDQANALGYHDEPKPGEYMASCFLADIEAAGVDPATTASHEAIEMAVDPDCVLYSLGGDGVMRAMEPGDPVEDTIYRLHDFPDYALSNFVHRAWFGSADGTYDQLGVLEAPYVRTGGGYVLQVINGLVQTDPLDAQLAPHKSHPTSRTARRLGHNRGR